MAIEITHQADGDRGRYHLLVDGAEAGELDYRMHEGRRVFVHTGVRDEYEGQGLAGQLAARVLDDARADGLQIVPLCPYVRGYLERHDEYADLIDHDLWDRLRAR
ncbi:MAG: GNAT family N-acetyltransferase [Acidimicrobiales bacterium]